jgi:hypothetical protein
MANASRLHSRDCSGNLEKVAIPRLSNHRSMSNAGTSRPTSPNQGHRPHIRRLGIGSIGEEGIPHLLYPDAHDQDSERCSEPPFASSSSSRTGKVRCPDLRILLDHRLYPNDPAADGRISGHRIPCPAMTIVLRSHRCSSSVPARFASSAFVMRGVRGLGRPPVMSLVRVVSRGILARMDGSTVWQMEFRWSSDSAGVSGSRPSPALPVWP